MLMCKMERPARQPRGIQTMVKEGEIVFEGRRVQNKYVVCMFAFFMCVYVHSIMFVHFAEVEVTTTSRFITSPIPFFFCG